MSSGRDSQRRRVDAQDEGHNSNSNSSNSSSSSTTSKGNQRFTRPSTPPSTTTTTTSRRRRVTMRSGNRIFHMNSDEFGELGDVLSKRLAQTMSNFKDRLRGRRGGGGGSSMGSRLDDGDDEWDGGGGGDGMTQLSHHTRWAHRRKHPPNALVFHGREGMEFLHLYTGYALTHVIPLGSDTYYEDVNDDYLVESVANRIAVTTKTFGELGVSTSMECMGVIRTGAPLATDLVMNATICDTPGLFGSSMLLQRFMQTDRVDDAVSQTVNKLELLGSYNSVSQSSFGVAPLVLQLQYAARFGMTEIERRAVFMMDSGLVTCLDPGRKRVAWRTATRAAFTATADNRYPHLFSYSISQPQREDDTEYVGGGLQRFHRVEPYVVAVGDGLMTVMHSKDGTIADRVPIPHTPIGPALVVDFNGDGMNDIVLVTAYGIYGFVGSVQVSSNSVAELLSSMMGVLLLLFVTRDSNVWTSRSSSASGIGEGGEDHPPSEADGKTPPPPSMMMNPLSDFHEFGDELVLDEDEDEDEEEEEEVEEEETGMDGEMERLRV